MISNKTFDATAKWIGQHTASALFNGVASTAYNVVDVLAGPAKVVAAGGVWRDNPIVWPDASLLIHLGVRGLITDSAMVLGCAMQGVNLGFKRDSVLQRDGTIYWEAAKEAMTEVPSVSYIMDCWSRGYFDGRVADARAAITRAGGNPEVWNRYLSSFYEYPTVEQLSEARNRELISEDRWTEGVQRNGFGVGWTREMLKKLRERIPSIGDIVQATNRGFITHGQYRDMIQGMGFGNDITWPMYDKLLNRLPAPADVIHMAVKEAFSVDVANNLHLYDEFPADVTPFMQGAGLNWDAGFAIQSDGGIRQATIADLYWAAHWQPISPQQAIGMFHVCRPNRLARFAAAGVTVPEFTLDDVKRWLRINDYPPTVREQLVSLSFTPLRLSDIRQGLSLFYSVQTIPGFAAFLPDNLRQAILACNREWGIEQFRDRGVLPADAATQVDMVFASAALKYAQPVLMIEKGVTRKAFRTICDLYRKGVYTREDAETLLLRLGLRPAAVGTYLDAEEKVFQLQRLDKVLLALRKAFFGGGVNADQAIASLVNSGIVERRARDYVSMWSVESSISRRHASTEKILSWVAKGGMTIADARQRLFNLGWDDPDLRLLLVDAQSKLVTLQAQAMKAADSARRQRAADLLKVQRDLQKQANLVQAAIRRQTPVSTLQRMYRKGYFNSAQFLARMAGMGYEPDVAERYRKDAIDTVSIPTLQRWLTKREITEEVFIRNLLEKGINLETAQKYAIDAQTPLPQKLYPKPPADKTTAGTATLPLNPPPQSTDAAQPPPPTGATANEPSTTQLHTIPEQLHTQPEQLHTVPGQLGSNNPGG